MGFFDAFKGAFGKNRHGYDTRLGERLTKSAKGVMIHGSWRPHIAINRVKGPHDVLMSRRERRVWARKNFVRGPRGVIAVQRGDKLDG